MFFSFSLLFKDGNVMLFVTEFPMFQLNSWAHIGVLKQYLEGREGGRKGWTEGQALD